MENYLKKKCLRQIMLGRDNTTIATFKGDESVPSAVLKKQRVVGALDYWKWHEFSVRLVSIATMPGP